MITKDFKEYIDKKVRVTFMDGQEIVGELDSIAPDYDTETGKDEIEIFVSGVYITAPVDEVKKVDII